MHNILFHKQLLQELIGFLVILHVFKNMIIKNFLNKFNISLVFVLEQRICNFGDYVILKRIKIEEVRCGKLFINDFDSLFEDSKNLRV